MPITAIAQTAGADADQDSDDQHLEAHLYRDRDRERERRDQQERSADSDNRGGAAHQDAVQHRPRHDGARSHAERLEDRDVPEAVQAGDVADERDDAQRAGGVVGSE